MTVEELNSLPEHLRQIVQENLRRENTPEAAKLLQDAEKEARNNPTVTVEELNRMPAHLRSIALENLRRENTEEARKLVKAAQKNYVPPPTEVPPVPKREPTQAERRASVIRGFPYAERLAAVRQLGAGEDSNDFAVLELMMADPDQTTKEEAARALEARQKAVERSAQKAKPVPVPVYTPPAAEFGAVRLSPARLVANHISPFEFGRMTGRGVPIPASEASVYYGHSFSCGCGDAHILNANIPVPREIPGRNKFVAGCPDNENVLNFLKVRGFFRIAGLEAICSTRIQTQQDFDEFCLGVIQAQIG